MVEVKADALEDSFDAIEQEEDGVAALKAELEALKSRIATGTIAAQRPALDGVKSAIGGEQVVGAREAAIASPAGGSTVDSEARTAIGAILATLRNHGLIET